MYNMVLVIAGLGEGSHLLASVGVVKEALMADVLVVVSSPLPLLVMFIVLVVLVHMPM